MQTPPRLERDVFEAMLDRLVEGNDLAEAVTELQMQEVAYQAVLGALAKDLQPSLVDFLR